MLWKKIVEIAGSVVGAKHKADGRSDLVGAFIAGRYPIPQACSLAAKVNRVMGLLANPTPASPVRELLHFLPTALATVLQQKTEVTQRPSIQ
jgi:hypothetical protein